MNKNRKTSKLKLTGFPFPFSLLQVQKQVYVSFALQATWLCAAHIRRDDFQENYQP